MTKKNREENKMRKVIYILIAVAMLLSSKGIALAHSGRTDSWGGHWNRVDYGVPVYEYHGR